LVAGCVVCLGLSADHKTGFGLGDLPSFLSAGGPLVLGRTENCLA